MNSIFEGTKCTSFTSTDKNLSNASSSPSSNNIITTKKQSTGQRPMNRFLFCNTVCDNSFISVSSRRCRAAPLSLILSSLLCSSNIQIKLLSSTVNCILMALYFLCNTSDFISLHNFLITAFELIKSYSLE